MFLEISKWHNFTCQFKQSWIFCVSVNCLNWIIWFSLIRYTCENWTSNTLFHDLKLKIKRLDTEYSHKDIDEKITLSNSLLKQLFQTDTGFTFLDSIKNPKKTLYRDEHLTIQQLIHKVIKIIQNDEDFEIIFPSIIGSLGIFMPRNF